MSKLKLLGVLCASFIVAQNAAALPKNFRLITPAKVKKTSDSTLKVVYRIPCLNDSSSSVILSADDSGDGLVAVGVAYSQDYAICQPDGELHKFTKLIDTSKRGWNGDFVFVSMSVETFNLRLFKYINARMDRGNPTIGAILKDKLPQLKKIKIVENTLNCLGHQSWLGPSQVVGICTVKVVAKTANGKIYNGLYAITVSEDLNNPGSGKSISMNEVSAFIN